MTQQSGGAKPTYETLEQLLLVTRERLVSSTIALTELETALRIEKSTVSMLKNQLKQCVSDKDADR
jgi:hypothetical protein